MPVLSSQGPREVEIAADTHPYSIQSTVEIEGHQINVVHQSMTMTDQNTRS
jgi:hypothetical protein